MLSILISPAMFELGVADYTPHFEARAKMAQIHAQLKKIHLSQQKSAHRTKR
jgi:hypothetical protein